MARSKRRASKRSKAQQPSPSPSPEYQHLSELMQNAKAAYATLSYYRDITAAFASVAEHATPDDQDIVETVTEEADKLQLQKRTFDAAVQAVDAFAEVLHFSDQLAAPRQDPELAEEVEGAIADAEASDEDAES